MKKSLARFLQMALVLATGIVPASSATLMTNIFSTNVTDLFFSATVTNLLTLPGTNNGDLAFAPGYHFTDDRGGGWFIWTNGATGVTGDGGRWIVVTNCGYWSRILKGEAANVKMWGAFGNSSTDDTIAFQSAVNACTTNVWTGELLIPSGEYMLSNTVYFPSGLHIRGESVDTSIIIMKNHDVNILCSTNAASALNGNFSQSVSDQDILIENLYFIFEPEATNGAGIIVYSPAENAVIRNVSINWGGYGIRALGNTSPGLKVYNAYFDSPYQASISIEGYLSNHWIGAAGPVTLSSISSDHVRDDSNATARFVHINRGYPDVTITDMKAEGQFGGGLVRYDLSNVGNLDTLGSVRVVSSTYACYTNGSSSSGPCDVVVLNADGSRTASVVLDHVSLSGPPGPRYLINDNLAKRVEYPIAGYSQGRLPIQYESEIAYTDTNMPPQSRYIVGGSALCTFVPTQTNAWYRVMTWEGHQGARLVTRSMADSSEFSADVAGGWGSTLINVIRNNVDTPGWDSERPRVTQARAGSYWSYSGAGISFVDVFVARWPYPGQGENIVFAEPLDGTSQNWPDSRVHLCPPMLITNLPATGLVDCVTNSLIR